MGGHESRGGPGSDRAAAVVVGSDVTVVEEPSTRSKGRADEAGAVQQAFRPVDRPRRSR